MIGHQDNDQDVATIEHSVLNNTSISEEEENRRLESSGLCLVNRSCQWGWLHTPLTPSMYPPVANTVTVIPSESAKIYSEKGAVIGRREQVETDSLPVIQPESDLEDISLTTPSTPSTVYKVCDNKSVCDRVCNNKNVQYTTSVTPLLNPDSERDQSNYKVIRVRDIVGTVAIISGSLMLLSTLMALDSLREGNIMEKTNTMEDNMAIITQKRIGHMNPKTYKNITAKTTDTTAHTKNITDQTTKSTALTGSTAHLFGQTTSPATHLHTTPTPTPGDSALPLKTTTIVTTTPTTIVSTTPTTLMTTTYTTYTKTPLTTTFYTTTTGPRKRKYTTKK